ncbi:hypothetical protein TNIN_481981 [Trichonephila inaurata madagascariensis]|uniref:Uncharacterized protein n=1 Tax=Trichonephila inaurata madagascariensis TaxID=2747483 RepID=A0A8X6XYK1_9ARAC|nr:hypothetical protein TNIN_481981 [Trichonephila inaurata madagascariensis]
MLNCKTLNSQLRLSLANQIEIRRGISTDTQPTPPYKPFKIRSIARSPFPRPNGSGGGEQPGIRESSDHINQNDAL